MKEFKPETIGKIAKQFQKSRILLTAVELKVFKYLTADGKSPDILAGEIDCDSRALDRLLNALTVMELVNKNNGLFSVRKDVKNLLDPESDNYLGHLEHNAQLWHSWSNLTESVRTGKGKSQSITERSGEWYESFIAAMQHRAEWQADKFADLIETAENPVILDVGGGSGAFSSVFVKKGRSEKVVIFDLPEVIPITKKYMSKTNIAKHIHYCPGNFLNDPLPGGNDLIILSAIIHMNSPEQNQELINKCYSAMRAGGKIAIMDFIMDEERISPGYGVFFAINMLAGTEAGDTYTENEVKSWLNKSGFITPGRIDTGFGTTIITGIKKSR